MSQLKSASLQSETSAIRLRRLLPSHELGDDKPSVLLQCLRNFAEEQVTDQVLRTIFMEQLPENVRTVLAISETSDLSKLAMQVDKILEKAKPLGLAVQPVDAETETIGKMAADIAALTKQMAKSIKQTRGRAHSESKERKNYRGRSQSKSIKDNNKNKICYYYRKFDTKAYKCAPLCEFGNPKKSEN